MGTMKPSAVAFYNDPAAGVQRGDEMLSLFVGGSSVREVSEKFDVCYSRACTLLHRAAQHAGFSDHYEARIVRNPTHPYSVKKLKEAAEDRAFMNTLDLQS